jgi:hypothetical protein
LVLSLVLTVGGSRLSAQPAAPAPPKEYKARVRYSIHAVGNQRIAQFLAMTRYLESIGFNKDPGPENEAEDPDQTLLTGTIASSRTRDLLNERHVLAILLLPPDFTVPAEADRPVKVQLTLKGGLLLPSQRLLADQVRVFLEEIGFREAIGYDNRGHTRMVGWIPAANLDQLLEDLRWQSTGWVAPQVPAVALPLPLRNGWPVLVAEVVPEPAGLGPAKLRAPARATAPGQEYLLKIAADLRVLGKQVEPTRMEVILGSPPREDDPIWRRDLAAAAPGLLIQGQLGQIVTIRARPNQAAALARLPQVVTVRLPRPATVQDVSVNHTIHDVQAALTASGLTALHQQGHRGRGVRVAVVDGDFRGYQQFVGRQLPAGTRYVDLTTECEPSIEPRKYAEGGGSIGHGTQSALALALAAPEAELTLIRVDPEAPYQLLAAARYISGEPGRSDSLEERNDELASDALHLQTRREELVEERKQVLENFGQDEASVKRREALFKQEAEQARAEQDLARRQRRFTRLVEDLRGLKGIRVVACGLIWDDGYPLSGGSPLSRYFDDRPFRSAIWLQTGGNTRGQAWAGLFRDVDGNGVMEFAAPETPLQPGHWTRELNFLGWQPLDGQAVADLPQARVRVSIQWREPHEPEYWGQQPDPYRLPLANLQLVALRQRDPSGAKLPADDLDVVARSAGLPLRLDNAPTYATYEQTVELATAPGRYALRVEGQVPPTIRPASEPKLSGMQVAWELRPRIFLEVLDEPGRATGRVVFADFPTNQASFGMPADAHQVLTVAAADLAGKPEPYSPIGPAFGQELHRKPDVLSLPLLSPALRELKLTAGSSLATSFAAGALASATSAGVPPAKLADQVQRHPGAILRLP